MPNRKSDFLSTLCYVALLIGGIIWLLEALQVLDKMGELAGVLRLVRELAVFVAIAIGAYPFAKGHGKAWLVIYWIIIIIILLGIFFGTYTNIISFPWSK